MGLDPRPFTLRELLQMRNGREKQEWNHTALVAMILANANRDPKKKPWQFSHFHPFEEVKESGSTLRAENITDLKVLLPDKSKHASVTD